MDENFPNSGKKYSGPGNRESQTIEPKGIHTRHPIIQMAKVRILKTTKEKQRYTKEPPQGYKLNFQQKQCRPEGSGFIYLKCWKRKSTTKDTLPGKATFQNWRRCSFTISKWKEFITIKPALQEMLKDHLQEKIKDHKKKKMYRGKNLTGKGKYAVKPT